MKQDSIFKASLLGSLTTERPWVEVRMSREGRKNARVTSPCGLVWAYSHIFVLRGSPGWSVAGILPSDTPPSWLKYTIFHFFSDYRFIDSVSLHIEGWLAGPATLLYEELCLLEFPFQTTDQPPVVPGSGGEVMWQPACTKKPSEGSCGHVGP